MTDRSDSAPDEAAIRLAEAMLCRFGADLTRAHYLVKDHADLLVPIAAQLAEAQHFLDMNLCPQCGPDVERVEAERDAALATAEAIRAAAQDREVTGTDDDHHHPDDAEFARLARIDAVLASADPGRELRERHEQELQKLRDLLHEYETGEESLRVQEVIALRQKAAVLTGGLEARDREKQELEGKLLALRQAAQRYWDWHNHFRPEGHPDPYAVQRDAEEGMEAALADTATAAEQARAGIERGEAERWIHVLSGDHAGVFSCHRGRIATDFEDRVAARIRREALIEAADVLSGTFDYIPGKENPLVSMLRALATPAPCPHCHAQDGHEAECPGGTDAP